MEIRKILTYIHKPTKIDVGLSLMPKEFIIKVFELFALILICSTIIILIFNLPLIILDLIPKRNPIEMSMRNIIQIVIFIPIIEEIIFRGYLNLKKTFLFLSPMAFSFIWFLNHHSLLLAIILTSTVFIVIGSLFLVKPSRKRIDAFHDKNYKLIFYASALIFGLVHIMNFNLTNLQEMLIAPLLVLVQISMGILFAYYRVRYKSGLVICMLCHSLVNFIHVTPYLIGLVE